MQGDSFRIGLEPFLKVRSELIVGRFGSAPISVHWSALLLLPFAWAATRTVVGTLVSFAAFLSLILAHELGHALIARVNRLRVFSIQTFWLHGWCRYEESRSPAAEIAVAWGGVAAQAVLLLVALVLAKATVLGMGEIPALLEPLFFAWIPLNILTMFLNLLPIPPLDGAKAWGVLPLLWRRITRRKVQRPTAPSAKRPSTGKVVSLDAHRQSRKIEP